MTAFARRHAGRLLMLALLALPPQAIAQTVSSTAPALSEDLPEYSGNAPPSATGDVPSIGLRALVVPRHQAMVSSGITGRIARMPVRPGDTFAPGDLLVAFDCARLHAELAAAKASARATDLDLKAKRRQLELNSIGVLEVDLAHAEADRARAEVAAVAADAAGCTIVAPFAGRVVRFEANPFETVRSGEGILEILDDSSPEVEAIVPSTWLRWLGIGQTFRLHLDETGTSHDILVTRLGARIDPASQSVLVTGTFSDVPAAIRATIRAGMSGEARFTRPPEGGR